MTQTLVADLIQLLTPEGEAGLTGPYANYISTLTVQDLLDMYEAMVVTRAFDTAATALQRQGELGLWCPSLGQEAAQVGSAWALKPQDFAFPGYRDHAVLKVRGVDLMDILKHVRGVDHGGWNPRDHNCHLYTLVVGAQTLHATGYAMGVRKDGACATGDPEQDQAVIAYFGDGASSEGDVSESLVFAATHQAPIVFFCQNNQWAISEPTTRQTAVPLSRRGEGFGIPGVRVDGNDVLATYAVTAAALNAARAGQGPQFIEAFTYRMGPHTTSDDPTRYRRGDDLEAWQARDPIDRMRRLLENQSLAEPGFFEDVEAIAAAVAEEARQAVRGLEPHDLAYFFDLAYATPHTLVDEEKTWWTDYEATLAGVAGQAGVR